MIYKGLTNISHLTDAFFGICINSYISQDLQSLASKLWICFFSLKKSDPKDCVYHSPLIHLIGLMSVFSDSLTCNACASRRRPRSLSGPLKMSDIPL